MSIVDKFTVFDVQFDTVRALQIYQEKHQESRIRPEESRRNEGYIPMALREKGNVPTGSKDINVCTQGEFVDGTHVRGGVVR